MLIGNGLLNIIESSLLAHSKALAGAINGTLGYNVKSVLFDDYTLEERLPEQDIIGCWQLEFEVDEHIVSGTFLLTLSTLNDSGLFRLRNAASLVFDEIKPMQEFNLYQPDGTQVEGTIIVMNGVKMLPVEKGDERPAKTFAIPFKCTRTIGL
jgi:hypothetical protein